MDWLRNLFRMDIPSRPDAVRQGNMAQEDVQESMKNQPSMGEKLDKLSNRPEWFTKLKTTFKRSKK